MKLATLTAIALFITVGTPAVFAEEAATAKCEMCEMMKKKAAAKAKTEQQSTELDELVTEMNGSLGSKKIEAMAAIVTRLVEHHKALHGSKAAPQPVPAKEQAHQH